MAKRPISRDTELSTMKLIREKLIDVYEIVDKSFLEAANRINDQTEYWEIYNCEISDNQFYNGNSQIFVPIVSDAIDARVTRFTNQIFPQSGRHVQVVTPDPDLPSAIMALMDHYVMTARLRDVVVPAALRNGDIEGQWNLYASWSEKKRHTVTRVQKPPEVNGMEVPGGDLVETMEEETITSAGPCVEVLPDSDVMVVPATSDTIDDALDSGGAVCILRRWSKAKIKQMAKDGHFIQSEADALMDDMNAAGNSERTDAKKLHVDSAGIKEKGKQVLGYEVWTKLKVDGEMRLTVSYFAGAERILGCKLNPYWCDLCPLISAPVQKISGSFKGLSKVKKVAPLQYGANDAINEAMDSATYALLPIIMTDPIKNPRVGSMVMDLAAVWEVDPNSTKFAQFPALWKDGLEIVATYKNEIFQTLSVNPSMIPGQTGKPGSKRNQAEIANEQQVDIITANDTVGAFEILLSELVQRFAWYDHQFRDEEITIRAYGQMGIEARMESIPPIQMNNRFWFRWSGSEQARNSQRIQQMIAFLGVLQKMPPQMLSGKRIDGAAIIERAGDDIFGPTLSPRIIVDLRSELTMPPEEENGLLARRLDMPVHPMDNDQEHLQSHTQAMQMSGGDPSGAFRLHIQKHTKQMGQKAQQAQQQQMLQQMGPGGSGGAGKPGAQPGPPRTQGPPGMIHQDQLQDPSAMPRKM